MTAIRESIDMFVGSVISTVIVLVVLTIFIGWIYFIGLGFIWMAVKIFL